MRNLGRIADRPQSSPRELARAVHQLVVPKQRCQPVDPTSPRRPPLLGLVLDRLVKRSAEALVECLRDRRTRLGLAVRHSDCRAGIFRSKARHRAAEALSSQPAPNVLSRWPRGHAARQYQQVVTPTVEYRQRVHLELMRDNAKTFPAPDEPTLVESVRVWHCGYRSLGPLGSMVNLAGADIASFPDDSFDVLARAEKLRYLSVVHLPKVADLTALAKFKALETGAAPHPSVVGHQR